jgi:hypothetical protein
LQHAGTSAFVAEGARNCPRQTQALIDALERQNVAIADEINTIECRLDNAPRRSAGSLTRPASTTAWRQPLAGPSASAAVVARSVEMASTVGLLFSSR